MELSVWEETFRTTMKWEWLGKIHVGLWE